jgi:hypothetical protein
MSTTRMRTRAQSTSVSASSSSAPSASKRGTVVSTRSRAELVTAQMLERGYLRPEEMQVLNKYQGQSAQRGAELSGMLDYVWEKFLNESCDEAADKKTKNRTASRNHAAVDLHRLMDQDEQVQDFIDCKSGLPINIKRRVVLFMLEALQEQPARVVRQSEVQAFVTEQIEAFRKSNLSDEKAQLQVQLEQDQEKIDALAQQQAEVLAHVKTLMARCSEVMHTRQTILETLSSKPVSVLDVLTEEWLGTLHEWSQRNVRSNNGVATGGGNGLQPETIRVLALIHTNIVQMLADHAANSTSANKQRALDELTVQRAQQYKQDIERVLFPVQVVVNVHAG